jgi:hypothetical protein
MYAILSRIDFFLGLPEKPLGFVLFFFLDLLIGPTKYNAFVRGDFVVDLLLCYSSTKVKRRKRRPS